MVFYNSAHDHFTTTQSSRCLDIQCSTDCAALVSTETMVAVRTFQREVSFPMGGNTDELHSGSASPRFTISVPSTSRPRPWERWSLIGVPQNGTVSGSHLLSTFYNRTSTAIRFCHQGNILAKHFTERLPEGPRDTWWTTREIYVRSRTYLKNEGHIELVLEIVAYNGTATIIQTVLSLLNLPDSVRI